MMKTKKIILTIILTIIILILSGCVNGSTTPNIPDQGDDINHKPIIFDLPASPRTAFINQNITITCTTSDQDGDTLAYSWSSSPGGTINGIGSNITWKAPATKGTYTITCLVSDGKGGEDSKSVGITVASDSGGVRYSISWTEAESNGWKNPLGEGKELITSTAYDYDSGIYLYNHPEKKHMGIDIVSEENDKVYAIASGTIRKIERGSDPKKMVVIIEHTNSNNKDFFAIYGHVLARSDLEVEVNSEVKAGEKIGVVKKSGSPCHLHFGVNLSSEFIDDLLAGNCGWGLIPESANPSDYSWVEPINYLNTHSIENIVLGSITITASAGPHGSISPSGNVTVNQGLDKLFTISPNAGYQIADVLVDGSSVGAVSSYTFTNVSQAYTISATFSLSTATGLIHNLTKDTYYDTIQAALDDADSDNTIEVADGTYDENITFPSGKKVILQSVNGASSTIIRGNDDSATVISDSPREGTTLEGFTITHARGSKGIGIDTNGNLTIKNCTISGNSVCGICNDYGSITITGSTISGNSFPGYDGGGGGIFNKGSITITGSTISGNSAYYGGGIYNDYGSITITGSTISGNSTYYGGGGIYNYYGSITITGSTISGNSTRRSSGGGIYIYPLTSGTITIGGESPTDKNTICGNYKNGEDPSLDQQIMDNSGSLYETYKDTNYISVYCE